MKGALASIFVQFLEDVNLLYKFMYHIYYSEIILKCI
jgi:hypothetical protein